MRAGKALGILHMCLDSPKSSLLEIAKSTKISCAGIYLQLQLEKNIATLNTIGGVNMICPPLPPGQFFFWILPCELSSEGCFKCKYKYRDPDEDTLFA